MELDEVTTPGDGDDALAAVMREQARVLTRVIEDGSPEDVLAAFKVYAEAIISYSIEAIEVADAIEDREFLDFVENLIVQMDKVTQIDPSS